MEIFIASDHAGFERKLKVLEFLRAQKNLEVTDLGPFDLESVDYPDYANKVCTRIKTQAPAFSSLIAMPTKVGILICGSGQGMAMRANKFSHIRAALCWNEESAKLSREHNDANVLCLSSRMLAEDLTFKIIDCFLKTPFAQGRHSRRVVKMTAPV